MSSQWFVFQNDVVTGPFSSDELQARMRQASVNGSDLVWGKGLEHWTSARQWQDKLGALTETVVAEIPVDTWHFALNGQSHGPFTRVEMVEKLKNAQPFNDVMIWTKGMKEWVSIFEFHDLLSAVGINKRAFPRADLQGKVIIKCDGLTLIANLLTISEGGLGAQLDTGLVPGQNVNLEVQSPNLHSSFQTKAEVRYLANGVLGLKFINLNAEAKTAIIAYVRQSQTRFVLKAA